MKPTQAILRQRLDELLAIRLDGATFPDVRRYVAEKEAAGEQPWTIPDGGRPVSERTLWRYIEQTNRMIAAMSRVSRQRRRQLHIARRENLYAKAVAQGDMRAASAILRDLAEFQGDYPAKKTQVKGKEGGPVILEIIEQTIGQQGPVALDIDEEIVTHEGASKPDTPHDPAASGPEEFPAI